MIHLLFYKYKGALDVLRETIEIGAPTKLLFVNRAGDANNLASQVAHISLLRK